MIGKLTKEQELRIPEYVERWLKIGLSTERINRRKATSIMEDFYREILNQKEPIIVIVDSPISAYYATLILYGIRNQVRNQVENQVGNQVWNQVRNQVENQVGNQVGNQVWNQVGNQVWNQVWNQVENQVGNQVGNQVWNQVWNQVRNQVGNQVWNQVENQVGNQVWNWICPYIYGSFMASYFSYYDFINQVLGIKYDVQSKYEIYQSTSKLGYTYCLDKYCIISENPSQIKMKNGRLHSEDSPAIDYCGELQIFALNGIMMKPEYILTSADKIKPEIILNEKSVDVRRELIRKVGIKKLVSLGKQIDEWGYYKLLDMRSLLLSNSYEPYLLMLNPSTPDTWHLEGVSHECKTVEQALNYRKPNEMKKIPVSIDGEAWYQQGDVCIWPEKALTLQNMPIVLT